MKRIISALSVGLFVSFMVLTAKYNTVEKETVTVMVEDFSECSMEQPKLEVKIIEDTIEDAIEEEIAPEPIFYALEEIDQFTDYEIELIALVTMAEAEGECELGKRLVIDTILNRVYSDYFPDTVKEVVYQKNQFESMWNGRVDRCEIQDDICDLVREEIESRENTEVMFFRTGKYSKYGEPLFQVENHYFSRY